MNHSSILSRSAALALGVMTFGVADAMARIVAPAQVQGGWGCHACDPCGGRPVLRRGLGTCMTPLTGPDCPLINRPGPCGQDNPR
jgi:hypothetical protein